MGSEYSSYRSLSIPYVENDKEGWLTNALIDTVSTMGAFHYQNSGGELLLSVKILSLEDENIGYRKDLEKDDEKVKRRIIPCEGRKTINVLVKLMDKRTDKIIKGPVKVTTSVDYDYVDPNALNDLSFINRNARRETVLRFSLGQLEAIDSAQEASLFPLYKICAKEIVDIFFSN